MEQKIEKNGRARTALLVEFIHAPPKDEKDLGKLADFAEIVKLRGKELKTYDHYIGVIRNLELGTTKEFILEEWRPL